MKEITYLEDSRSLEDNIKIYLGDLKVKAPNAFYCLSIGSNGGFL
jgi:hypothetical protein